MSHAAAQRQDYAAGGDIAHAIALVLERCSILIRQVPPAAVLALIGCRPRRHLTRRQLGWQALGWKVPARQGVAEVAPGEATNDPGGAGVHGWLPVEE